MGAEALLDVALSAKGKAGTWTHCLQPLQTCPSHPRGLVRGHIPCRISSKNCGFQAFLAWPSYFSEKKTEESTFTESHAGPINWVSLIFHCGLAMKLFKFISQMRKLRSGEVHWRLFIFKMHFPPKNKEFSVLKGARE